ncbi:MAG: hypothetical protein ACLQVD_07365 [Capsulimonadaceae bacterium]
MVRISGKALVASWRPYESGGSSQLRSSQMQCDSVTVIDQVVIAQHPDGFWETVPLANCCIIWQGKPTISVVSENGEEFPLTVVGKEHTLADELVAAQSANRSTRFAPPPTQRAAAPAPPQPVESR